MLPISRRSLRRQVARVAEELATRNGAGPDLCAGGADAIPALAPGVTVLSGSLTETADRLVADLLEAS